MYHKNELSLEEKYIAVMSRFELWGRIFDESMPENLVAFALQGEKHAIADVLYFWENRDNENFKQAYSDFYKYVPSKYFDAIKNSKYIKDLKVSYLNSPHFLFGDEYLILSQVMATEEDRDKLAFKAAKYYLEDLKEYKNYFSGAMFLKVLEQNAEVTGKEINDCPVAKDIKTFLLWGNDKTRERLFNSLVSDVKKAVIKNTRRSEDYKSKFARAYAMKNDFPLSQYLKVNRKSLDSFIELSNSYEKVERVSEKDISDNIN